MKDKKLVIVLILIIIFLLVGGAYYLGMRNSNISGQQNQVLVTNNVESTCTADSTPSLKIISPKQGDSYIAGQQVAIKWTSCNVKNIYIGSGSGGKNFGLITSNPISASSGSYLWTVSNPAKRFTEVDLNNYQIVISEDKPNGSVYKSNIFSVSGDDIQIQGGNNPVFVQPKAGSIYYRGSGMSIIIGTDPRWEHCANGLELRTLDGKIHGAIAMTKPGVAHYKWDNIGYTTGSCGSGAGEIKNIVNPGSYKICFSESNPENGTGYSSYCSGVFEIK
jgi:hypothetical protein